MNATAGPDWMGEVLRLFGRHLRGRESQERVAAAFAEIDRRLRDGREVDVTVHERREAEFHEEAIASARLDVLPATGTVGRVDDLMRSPRSRPELELTTGSAADAEHSRAFAVDLELDIGYRHPDASSGGSTVLDLGEDGVFAALEHLLEWAPWFTVRNVREIEGSAVPAA